MKQKIVIVIISLIIFLFFAIFNSLSITAKRFSQFEERQVSRAGNYYQPEWSIDSRYLAYLERSNVSYLHVYDIDTNADWVIVVDELVVQFNWRPNNYLTLLTYRPDLSGSPVPSVFDLQELDIHGNNRVTLLEGIADVGDFEWLSDAKNLLILSKNELRHSIYMIDIVSNSHRLLLHDSDIQLESIVSFALSPDDRYLVIYGLRDDSQSALAVLVIYDILLEIVRETIIPSQILNDNTLAYPRAGISDDTNAQWLRQGEWFLSSFFAPSGRCYNYSLFFFHMSDSTRSFCIPTVGGAIAFPTVSPDLNYLSYITVLGSQNNYVTIVELTSFGNLLH